MKKLSGFLSGLAQITVGVLFIVLKIEIIKIATIILGLFFLTFGIVDLVNNLYFFGIPKVTIGGVAVILGLFGEKIAIYILCVLLIIHGITALIDYFKQAKFLDLKEKIIKLAQPAVLVIVAVLLLCSNGGVVSWLMVLIGVLLVITGIAMVTEQVFKIKKNKA